MDKRTKIERVGLIKENANGALMEIIEYKNKRDMLVKFVDHNYITFARYTQFKKGTLKSPYDRTVHGIGYIGEGDYKPSINSKATIQYNIWHHMIRRCYDEDYHIKKPTYKECSVSDKWHNYQNFAKWFNENYYQIEGEIMHLDKDILIKGNKTYSHENCVFVPQRINSLFLKSDGSRGNLPIGVYYSKTQEKLLTNRCYGSKCCNGKKDVHLGFYDNPNDAFLVYKIYKEKLIKQVAEDYKNKIPNKLYEAMLRYKVEITD